MDGLLLELRGDSLPLSTEMDVVGYSLELASGVPMEAPAYDSTFWTGPIRLSGDSTTLQVEMDSSLATVEYAFGPDSTVMLVFMRASSRVELPELAWEGPPGPEDDRDSTQAAYSDSLVYESFESGRTSPWLEEFDCVVLDPGHGGRDPGAVGYSGTYEKDRTLEVALLVRDLLRIRCPDLRVVMTRDDDSYVSLGERTRVANRERADLFVSIHCNASTNRSAMGFETFFLSRARTDDARAVAALENRAARFDEEEPASADDPLSFLLADIAQRLYLNQSSEFAGTIQRRLAGIRAGQPDRGVKQAGFYVLRGAFMPSVLVELAFISNPREERLLRQLDYRYAAAEAIVAAIMDFSGTDLASRGTGR
jgi:N-acetylmuramoyl-L-alanine amidase